MAKNPTSSAARKPLPFFLLAALALALGGVASAQLPLAMASDTIEVSASLPDPSIRIRLETPGGQDLDVFDYGQWVYGRTPGPEVALLLDYEYRPNPNTLYLVIEPEDFPTGYDLYWNDVLLDADGLGAFEGQLSIAAPHNIAGEGYFPVRETATHSQLLSDSGQHYLALDLFVDADNRPTEELSGRIVATVTLH